MGKFMCLCGDKFKTQEEGDEHRKQYIHLEFKEGFLPHLILKYRRSSRFSNWFWSIDISFHLALWAGVIVNCMIMFHVHWGFWATMVESFCMGFILSRLFQK